MSAPALIVPALIVIDVQRAFDEWEAAGQRRHNPDAIHPEDVHAMTLANLHDEFARVAWTAEVVEAALAR